MLSCWCIRLRPTPERDYKTVDEAEKRLARVYECKVCFNAPISAVHVPCGHAVCCSKCAVKMPKRCIICRKKGNSIPLILS